MVTDFYEEMTNVDSWISQVRRCILHCSNVPRPYMQRKLLKLESAKYHLDKAHVQYIKRRDR